MSLKPNQKTASDGGHEKNRGHATAGAARTANPKPVHRSRISFEDLINLSFLLVIWSFLVSFFTPDPLRSKTTTTGGDAENRQDKGGAGIRQQRMLRLGLLGSIRNRPKLQML